MSAKYAQQSMILTYQIFTILTDQIIHTLKNEFVYFCM